MGLTCQGGRKEKEMLSGILPPKPNVCPECAVKHGPNEPHDLHSLYYQMYFRLKYGRQPTWKDAMNHCDEQVRKMWEEELLKIGEKIE